FSALFSFVSPPPKSPPFPYTTLFRSLGAQIALGSAACDHAVLPAEPIRVVLEPGVEVRVGDRDHRSGQQGERQPSIHEPVLGSRLPRTARVQRGQWVAPGVRGGGDPDVGDYLVARALSFERELLQQPAHQRASCATD